MTTHHAHDGPDHRAVVAALPQAERERLTARADAPGLVRLAIHGGAIVGLGAAILAPVPFWPLLLVPQGILIVFLFTTLHETSHETAFRTGWLNRAVAIVSGILVVVPPVWFRYFHFAHHRHTHDPDNDPELMSPKPRTVWEYVRYLSGIPLWVAMLKVVVRNAVGRDFEDYVPEKARARVVREGRALVVFYATLAAGSVALGSAALLWAWVVPAILGQPFLRAYLLAEHARCPHVANMLENTRTTFTNRIVRFVAWNMPFHAEHHAYPAVPFHRLPDFHVVVREHLRTTERGYARFHRKFARDLA
ncbi:MAG: fatty acid desaturase family protein [Rhizobiaceae bacterium]